jgi:hypothetical protein
MTRYIPSLKIIVFALVFKQKSFAYEKIIILTYLRFFMYGDYSSRKKTVFCLEKQFSPFIRVHVKNV